MSASQPTQMDGCAYCKNISVCVICGKGYAEAVRAERTAAVNSHAALLASHQRLAEALEAVAATSSDISDETLTHYASGEFDHQTTAEAQAMLDVRAALATIPKEAP